jgi:hypothetical protein
MFQKSKTTAGKYNVPALATAGPEFTALTEKESEIQTLIHRLDVERSKLWGVANSGRDDGDDKVAALLGDEPVPADPSKQSARARLTEIAAETETARKALDVVRSRIAAARTAASAKVVEAVRPEYGRRVQVLGQALVAAYVAHSELLELTDQLNAADVAWSGLTPLQATRLLGDRRDNYSQLAIWLREAASAGYLKPADIPTEIR